MLSTVSPTDKRSDLRAKISAASDEGGSTIVAPGAHDALTARIAAARGASVVYMTGAGTAGGQLGVPDVALARMHDAVVNAGHMAAAIDVPLIADADDGYGGPLQVYRTVRAFETAGASAIHLEDEASPKRCPFLSTETPLPYDVISLDEMVQKIRAAVEARFDPNFLIIARCDAKEIMGIDEALRRCDAYLRAGADALFPVPYIGPDSDRTREDLDRFHREFRGAVMFQATGDGIYPGYPSAAELSTLGVTVAAYAVQSVCVVTRAFGDSVDHLLAEGTVDGYQGMATFDEYSNTVGLGEYMELWEKFAPEAAAISQSR